MDLPGMPAPAVAAFKKVLRSTPTSRSDIPAMPPVESELGDYPASAHMIISINASKDGGNSVSPDGKSFNWSM